MKSDDIQDEIVNLYGNMLGTRAPSLLMIDFPTMRTGDTLSYQDRSYLFQPVIEDEIDFALKGIDHSIALGIEGFNDVFIKKTWKVN